MGYVFSASRAEMADSAGIEAGGLADLLTEGEIHWGFESWDVGRAVGAGIYARTSARVRVN